MNNTGRDGKEEVKLHAATKQTLIFNPPAVLTIHLKRFEQVWCVRPIGILPGYKHLIYDLI